MIDLDAGDGQPGRLPALGDRQQTLDNGFLVQLRQLAVEARYQPERAAVLLQQAEIGRDFPPALAWMHLQRQHPQPGEQIAAVRQRIGVLRRPNPLPNVNLLIPT